jgi:hypothetical protein
MRTASSSLVLVEIMLSECGIATAASGAAASRQKRSGACRRSGDSARRPADAVITVCMSTIERFLLLTITVECSDVALAMRRSHTTGVCCSYGSLRIARDSPITRLMGHSRNRSDFRGILSLLRTVGVF